jgi:SAM-dependent methyltransferase
VSDARAEEWAARARSFGSVADAYDRHRPGYPAALYADVLALGPGPRVLEAGAGTGRATLGLVEAGATVHAVEPDAEMAAVLRHRTHGLAVTVQQARFEDSVPDPGSADVVTAAQAWHWVDPAAGATVAARALVPGGVLAVWWNRPRELAGPAWEAVHDAYARYAPELDRRRQGHTHTHGVSDGALPGFSAWTDATYEWSAVYDATSYTALVSTHSDHIRLDADVRARLLDGVRAAIDDVGGGQIEYPYRTVLRRASRTG